VNISWGNSSQSANYQFIKSKVGFEGKLEFAQLQKCVQKKTEMQKMN